MCIAKNINIAISEGNIEHFRRGVRLMLLSISVPSRMRITMPGFIDVGFALHMNLRMA
jgi:hypothetical protein